MGKWFIAAFLFLYMFFSCANIFSASTDEEEDYQIRLDKRQEYCSTRYTIYIADPELIQPLDDLNQNNIGRVSQLYCMATFYEDNGRLNEAMQSYQSILNIEPQFIDILIKVGDFYSSSYFNDLDLAVYYYNNALNSIDTYLTNNITFLDPYLNTFDKIVDIYTALGLNSDVIKKYDEIINKLVNMAENPIYVDSIDEITSAQVDYMIEKARLSSTNDAIHIYETILFDIDPENSEAINELAQIYYDLGLLNETKALLEHYPVDDFLLGKVYFDLGEYDKALEIFNDVLRNNSANAEAYYYRGQIYYIKGACDKARSDIRRAQSLDPALVDSEWSNLSC